MRRLFSAKKTVFLKRKNNEWRQLLHNDDEWNSSLSDKEFTSFFFGLAHIMPAAGNAHECIADDFLDDCAIAAGCEQLALSLPLRILPAFYIPRFLATSSILCSVRNCWQPRVHIRKWQGGDNDGLLSKPVYVSVFLSVHINQWNVTRRKGII